MASNFPGVVGSRTVELGFQLPPAASSQKVVGSRVVELSWLVRFLPCGLLPKSGVGFKHFSCLVLGLAHGRKVGWL